MDVENWEKNKKKGKKILRYNFIHEVQKYDNNGIGQVYRGR